MEFKDYIRILRKRFLWFLISFILLLSVFPVFEHYRKRRTRIYYTSTASILAKEEVFFANVVRSLSAVPYVKISSISAETRINMLLRDITIFKESCAYFYRALQLTSLDAGQMMSLEQAKEILKTNKIVITPDDINNMKMLLSQNIQINSDKKVSGILNITATMETAQSAKNLANALAFAMINYAQKDKLETLQEIDKEVLQAIDSKSKRLLEIQSKTELATILDKELSLLYKNEEELQKERDLLEQRKSQLAETINRFIQHRKYIYETEPIIYLGKPLVELENDQKIQKIKQAITELKSEIENKSAVWTSSHPEIKERINKLRELQLRLKATYISVYKEKLTEYTTERKDIENRLYQTNLLLKENSKKIEELKKSYREMAIYQAEANKLNNEISKLSDSHQEIQSLLKYQTTGPLELLQQAEESYLKKSSFAPVSYPVWLFIGFAISLFIAYMREYIDTTISNEKDIKKYLGYPLLGIIPRVHRAQSLLLGQAANVALREVFNTNATIVVNILTNNNYKTLAVVSSIKEEGKTSYSINLCAALAGKKKYRVALIDADYRASPIGRLLNIERTHHSLRELSSCLDGNVDNENLIQDLFFETGINNFYVFLPERKTSYGDILDDLENNLGIVLKKLKERNLFDFIVVDTPPILTASDALVAAKNADATIFVVGCGLVSRQNILWAKHILESVTNNIIGSVLNLAPIGTGYEYYYYYYKKPRVK